jgi:hypothetical protein
MWNDGVAGNEEVKMNTESMIAALSKAILWGVETGGGTLRGAFAVWMLPNGTFVGQHETYPVPDGGAQLMLRVGDLGDLLGPTWDKGLERDEVDRPIVTAELARTWAAAWVSENGARRIEEVTEAGA